MNSRLNRQKGRTLSIFPEFNANHPKEICHVTRQEEDPFSDPSLLDIIDLNHSDGINSAVGAMLKLAKYNGVSNNEHEHLKTIFIDHMDIFRCSF